MTQEDKQLLLKELCARLPYGVIGYAGRRETLANISIQGFYKNMSRDGWHPIEQFKPYLRSMSSMTEEQRLELSRLTNDKFKFYLYTRKPEIICYEKYNYLEGLKVIDWLNEHHFDYRGLIEKGLALEALEGMYKTE